MIGVCSGVPLSLLFPTGHAFQHSVFPTAQSAEAGKSFLPLQAPEKPVTMASTSGSAPPLAGPPLQVALYSCQEHLARVFIHPAGRPGPRSSGYVRQGPCTGQQTRRDPPGRQEGGPGRVRAGNLAGPTSTRPRPGVLAKLVLRTCRCSRGGPKRRDDTPGEPGGACVDAIFHRP